MPHARILVVDDEPSVSRVVTSLLERSGYEAVTADRVELALQFLREGPEFDLVLSDVMMPEVNGFSLLDVIGQEHPGMPVVMVTAVHDVDVATNAFRNGAIDYLRKPFGKAHLLTVVERAVEHGRLRKQNLLYRHNLEAMVQARTERLRATMADLERSYDTTLEAMGDALDLRDAETEGHSRRVTAYTIALARELGLNAEELRVIARGAFLHDIGKISTPDRVLLKPGKLDAAETAIMREHCARGYQMVSKIPFLRKASEIVLTHQESFDGTGYPQGLKGEDIPLGARIFAIADTLDAITSDRPYRKGASFAAARDEIAKCAGRQFDPSLVDVFLRVPLDTWPSLCAQTKELDGLGAAAILCRPAMEYAY